MLLEDEEQTHQIILAAGSARALLSSRVLRKRGRRECRGAVTPRAHRQRTKKTCKQRQDRPGSPRLSLHEMDLRLIPFSPRRHAVTTVVDANALRLVGRIWLTSTSPNLTPAGGVRTLRFCRTPRASWPVSPSEKGRSRGAYLRSGDGLALRRPQTNPIPSASIVSRTMFATPANFPGRNVIRGLH
jgi:hypothetical protein